MDANEGVDGEIEEVGKKPASKKSRLSDLDKHSNNGHMRKCILNQVESNFDPVSNKNSPYSSRAQNHSHRSTYNRSKQNAKYSTEEKKLSAKIPTKIEKDNRDFQNRSQKWSEKGETKGGEILEDGELVDDNEATVKQRSHAVKAHAEGFASKSASKQANKGAKSERRKSGNQGKQNHNSNMKRKKHKYADGDDGDMSQHGKDSGPTWTLGYQMSNRRGPAFSHVEQGYGRGSKGYLSTPDIYDSPSDHSDEEMVPKALMTGGYIDASVAAFEKQGIFNRRVSLGPKRKFEKNEQHRGAEGSFEGPPKKKSFLDMQMFERPACKFYFKGKCTKGGMCQFNHDVKKPKKMEVCKYHLSVKGCIREACQFMHQDFPCKYYHTGANCFSGDQCKFSHDPLTDATRKALEMRIAAEDIIIPSNNCEKRPQEINNNPIVLGSPSQLRTDLKIIPSLFDIEAYQPGHSPKLPASQTVRPSGFYSETNAVSVPGPINNIGLMKSVITSNLNSQQGLAKQRSVGGAGLLHVPLRPGNTNSFMSSQQGLNPHHQRFALGPFVQVRNNQQPQNGHISPVLNMLDAVIHETTSQKGSDSQTNMLLKISMDVNDMSSNLDPVQADVNNVDCSSMGDNKMASDNIGSNANIQGCFSAGFTKVGNIETMKFANAMGPNGIKNVSQEENMELNARLNQIVSSNINALSGQQAMGQELCKSKRDLDFTNQRSLDNTEESQDVCELNKIKQLEEEDKKEAAAADDKEKVQLQGDQLPSGTSDDIQVKQGLNSSNTVLEKKENSLKIPTHLPKTQQELFKKIRQQQLLQGKELDKQKVHTTVGKDTAKAEIDDWYSSEEEETKPKLKDVLKKLNQESSSQASGSSSALGPQVTSSSEPPIIPPVASTFNIMQMINAIKGRSAVTKPLKENTETSAQPLKLSLASVCFQGVDTAMSPASPQTVATSIMKSFGILHNVSNCQPPPLAVDPPVVNAVPLTPINYVAVRISLNMPKPYTRLFDSVIVTDPAFKDDPRVKWHHSYIEKQVLIEPQEKVAVM